MLEPVARPTLQYFPTLSHKRHDFQKKVIEHKTHVLIFSAWFGESFLIIRRIKDSFITNLHRSSYKETTAVLVRL